jgi:hypothetical protein
MTTALSILVGTLIAIGLSEGWRQWRQGLRVREQLRKSALKHEAQRREYA